MGIKIHLAWGEVPVILKETHRKGQRGACQIREIRMAMPPVTMMSFLTVYFMMASFLK